MKHSNASSLRFMRDTLSDDTKSIKRVINTCLTSTQKEARNGMVLGDQVDV